MLSGRNLEVKYKGFIHEGVIIIVPMAQYIAEAWCMRSAERKKGNLLEMKRWEPHKWI